MQTKELTITNVMNIELIPILPNLRHYHIHGQAFGQQLQPEQHPVSLNSLQPQYDGLHTLLSHNQL